MMMVMMIIINLWGRRNNVVNTELSGAGFRRRGDVAHGPGDEALCRAEVVAAGADALPVPGDGGLSCLEGKRLASTLLSVASTGAIFGSL